MMFEKKVPRSSAVKLLLAAVLAFGLVPVGGALSPSSAHADDGSVSQEVPILEEGAEGIESAAVEADSQADPAVESANVAQDSDESSGGESIELMAETVVDLSVIPAGNTIAVDATDVTVGGTSTPHDGTLTLTGSGSGSDAVVSVDSSFQGTIVLDDVQLDKTDGSSIVLQAGAVVDMQVRGVSNTIVNTATTVTRSYAVISVPTGASLTISGETDAATDLLSISGSQVVSNSSGAAFGSGAIVGGNASSGSGSIVIEGVSLVVSAHIENTNTATTMYPGAAFRGAMIGSGYLGVASDIRISDADVTIDATPVVAGTAAAGSVNGALIGGGSGSVSDYSNVPAMTGDITIERSSVKAIAKTAQGSNTGAIIGSGSNGSVGGTILIDDSDVTAITASRGTGFAAAIGSGRYGSVSAIEINGGNVFAVVEAVGDTYGAGIGTGEGKDDTTNRVSVDSILIDGDAHVDASSQVPRAIEDTLFETGMGLPVPTSGSSSGAGIGGGKNADAPLIVINSGTVNAASLASSTSGSGFAFAPAIGAGGRAASGKGGVLGELTVNGGIIDATSNGWTSNSHALGAGDGSNLSKGTVTINGGTVQAKSKPYSPTVSNGRNGIGAGKVVINGGSVYSEYGGRKEVSIIGYGNGNWVDGSGAPVFPSLISTVSASSAITAGTIDGVACATIPSPGVYGINDVVTTDAGELCIWLPETATDVEGSVILTTTDGASSTYEYVRNSSVDRNYYDLSSWNAYRPEKKLSDLTIARLFGDERYRTGQQVASYGRDLSGEPVLIVASGHNDNFPDALAASSLSGAKGNAPIVLTDPWELGEATRDVIEAAPACTTVYIVGDTPSVSQAVEDEIASILPGATIKRMAGETRMHTAELIYDEIDASASKTAIIARSMDFPDSLSASSWAAYTVSPIFLTDFTEQSLTDGTIEALGNGDFERVIVLGSELSVPAAVAQQARDAAGLTDADIVRLGGIDRVDTSLKMAEWATDAARDVSERLSFDNVAVTRADSHSDALAGGALQGMHGAVVLLTPTEEARADVLATIAAAEADIAEIRFFGDHNAVSYDAMRGYIKAITCDGYKWAPDPSVEFPLD